MVYARLLTREKEGYLTNKVCFIRNNYTNLSRYFYVPSNLQSLEEVKHELPLAVKEAVKAII